MSLGIGVIGAGVMGADHVRTIAGHVARAHVVAVCDADAARAAAAAASAHGARSMTDPHALIADPAVEAVVVVSPDDTHVAYTLAALDAGKPVLCEKPLAPTRADCLKVLEREQKLGRRMVQVGFMRRFDPAYEDMKRGLEAGAIGPALLLHAVHRNATTPVFFQAMMTITNAAVHEFDIFRWLLGEEMVRIHVMRSRQSSTTKARDPIFLVMESAGGVVIDVELFMNSTYGYDIRTELVGEKGTLSMVPPVSAELRASGHLSFPFAADWRPRFAAAYRRQMQAWVDSIGTGRPVGASAWDGLVAIAIAEAGIESMETGAPVAITLPPKPALYG